MLIFEKMDGFLCITISVSKCFFATNVIFKFIPKMLNSNIMKIENRYAYVYIYLYPYIYIIVKKTFYGLFFLTSSVQDFTKIYQNTAFRE